MPALMHSASVSSSASMYRSTFTESITQDADRMHTSPPNRR